MCHFAELTKNCHSASMTVYAVRTAVHNIFTYLQKSTGMLKQYSYEMMLTHSSVNEN